MTIVKPITPQEAKDDFDNNKPWFVIQAFNNLIGKNFDGKEAKITKDEAIEEIIMLCPEKINRHDVFDRHWLEVENTYRKLGWKVVYECPDYTENFPSYFKFKK